MDKNLFYLMTYDKDRNLKVIKYEENKELITEKITNKIIQVFNICDKYLFYKLDDYHLTQLNTETNEKKNMT